LIVQYLRICVGECSTDAWDNDDDVDVESGGDGDDGGSGGGGDDGGGGGGGICRFAVSSCRRNSASSSFNAAFSNAVLSRSDMSSICKNRKNYYINKRYRSCSDIYFQYWKSIVYVTYIYYRFLVLAVYIGRMMWYDFTSSICDILFIYLKICTYDLSSLVIPWLVTTVSLD